MLTIYSDQTTIEGYATGMYHLDEYGKSSHEKYYEYGGITSYYCCECSCETDLITIKEFKASNRDNQIDEILKD